MTSGRRITDTRRHFESKLIVGHSGGHWSMETKVNNKGYHVISVGNGKREYAHVTAYKLYVGPVPDGLEIDHVCRTTWCVNPAHLEAVTHAENLRRAYPTCKYGHDLTDAGNVYIRATGGRVCKACTKRRNDAR